jgi:two-component system OmpR family sensor kinase
LQGGGPDRSSPYVGLRESERGLLLETLERLLALPTGELKVALCYATDVVASALRADKVDAFLYDASRDSLVAVGTSNQPLSALQRKVGLDVLPVANGGRVVYVFKTGQTFVTGHLDHDPEELKGVKEALGIRSKIGVPLTVGESRRGMMMIASQKPEFYSADDVRLAEAVARWVSIIVHRAELVEEMSRNAVEEGRRAVAEELITVLAHDLRNFIAPITLRLTLVRRRAERDRRDGDLKDVDIACRGLGRLAGMVSEILDVARVDQGVFRIDVEPTDPAAMLEEIARTLSGPDRPVVVKMAEDMIVLADPARLRQCLENVISNAVKHSPKGGTVTVLAARSRQGERPMARIEVMDEGPGIPPEILPRIFDRFVAGPRREGLGLGLYLARRIAALHGGELSVESKPGKGATFLLTVPCLDDSNGG